MSKRTRSLFELFLSYSIAIVVGVLIFTILPWEIFIWKVLVADISATIVIWIHGNMRQNSSVYDPYWSVIPPIILVLSSLSLGIDITTPAQLVILGITTWAIRLTWNWWIGWSDFSHQDWRYTMIKEKMPKLWHLSNLFGIMLMPTILVFLQLVVAIHILQAQAQANGLTFVGFLMIVGATILQATADAQMRQFKEKHKGSKKLIREGLWKVSRHPNYFGEMMVWWGVYVIYASTINTLDWLVISPILMTALFYFISIPMMEKKLLLSRPEYQQVQMEVSMIIPWFVKKVTKEEVAYTEGK